VNRTQVEVVFLAHFRELGVEVDFVPFDKSFEFFEIIVDDVVVKVKPPATAAAANAPTAGRHA